MSTMAITQTGVNVTARGPVATPVPPIEGGERVTDLPRPDLPAPSAVACPSDNARQATATTDGGCALCSSPIAYQQQAWRYCNGKPEHETCAVDCAPASATGHYGSQTGPTPVQQAPQRVGSTPYDTPARTDCGRRTRRRRAVSIPVTGAS